MEAFVCQSTVLDPTSQPSSQPSRQPTVRISSSLKNGLVAYYPFDGNANDNSGNGNHGILRGGVSLVADRFGQSNNAYNFDGTSACIEVPGQQFNFISNMSVSLWVKPFSSQPNTWNRLLDKGSWNRTYAPGGWTVQQFDNHLNSYIFIAPPSPFTNSIQFNSNQWNHLGMTKNGKIVKAFMNGNLDFTTELSGSANLVSTGNMPLLIGCNNGHYTIPASFLDTLYKGALDEIMIYDRVLTATEMIQLSVFDSPTSQPSRQPSSKPSSQPTRKPSSQPSIQPSSRPTRQPTTKPSRQPTCRPTSQPSRRPSNQPSSQPTSQPSRQPTSQPTQQPTTKPSKQPTSVPSTQPSCRPSNQPSTQPSGQPSSQPTV
jgi:hypothetical protein